MRLRGVGLMSLNASALKVTVEQQNDWILFESAWQKCGLDMCGQEWRVAHSELNDNFLPI